ncbi:DUF6975 family protein [Sphingomonas sp. AX6]|uniref:DUF6975 family protein n=1 Tax=Sphingomonas sp. AX6 TaxID=2653171 RepID=UPI0012F197C3|nr:hypothetical protein [Sphingomonas sp. AX6]VXC94409.1 conserved hypothetical protein [Sphingomonas sp. AX6]
MALDVAQIHSADGLWQSLAALVGSDGTRTHLHANALVAASPQARDLADAAHLVCSLHGRHPGVIDHAAQHRGVEAATGWLGAAAAAFAEERARIVALAVAAGPLPSTPGQAESEATVTAQRHALDMLSSSARNGCSLGASLALVLDWPALNAVLSAAGKRFGQDMPMPEFPSETDVETLVSTLAGSPGIERAVMFGAQQLLAQHRGLFDLLQARAEARDRV